MSVKIDNDSIVDSPAWGSVDHTAQRDLITEDASALKEMFAEIGETAEDKLPHHSIADGTMKVHKGGLQAAAKAMLGSRGGVNLKDRKKAARHLLKHFRHFKIEANPDLEKEAKYCLEYLRSLPMKHVDSPAECVKLIEIVHEFVNLFSARTSASPEKEEVDSYVVLETEEARKEILAKWGIKSYDKSEDTFHINHDCGEVLIQSRHDDQQLAHAAFGYDTSGTKDYSPTKEELDLINEKFSARPLDANEIKVYYAIVTGTQLNRNGQHLLTKAARYAADHVAGVPVMDNHDYLDTKSIFGLAFDGKALRSSDGNTRVAAKFLVPNKQQYESIHDGFQMGFNKQISIGFKINRKDAICDVCNKPMFTIDPETRWFKWCGHSPNQEYADGKYATMSIADMADFYEFSRVTVPAFKGAAVRKWSGDWGGPAINPCGGVSQSTNSLHSEIHSTFSHLFTEPRISTVLQQTGDETVSEQNSTPAAEPQVVSTPAVAPQPEVQQQQSAVSPQFDASAFVALNSSVGELIKAVNDMNTAYQVSNEAWKTELAAKEQQFETRLEETRQLLQNQVKAFNTFIEAAGFVAKNSNEDIARQVANAKPMGQTALNAEQNSGGDFYQHKFMNGIFKARNGR